MIILKILIKKPVSLKTLRIKTLPNVVITSDNIINNTNNLNFLIILFKIKIKTILNLG